MPRRHLYSVCFALCLPLVISAMLLMTGAPAHGQTAWFVDDDASGDPEKDGSASHPFDAIQEALNAAAGGDLVMVADGHYSGIGNRALDFNGKAIVLQSAGGPAGCILDAEYLDRVFLFHSGESSMSVVQGFSIINGCAESGGGIFCRANSSPVIRDNSIISCAADLGGGIACENSSPMISGNVIDQNSGDGGGIACVGGSAVIVGNIITANRSELGGMGGGLYLVDSAAVLINNAVLDNYSLDWGGGVYCTTSQPVLINNTLTGNTAQDGHGDGILCADSIMTVQNCIVWDNGGEEIYVRAGEAPTVENSDVRGGYEGPGNMDADPLLITTGEYCCLSHPAAGQAALSPCIDAGSESAASISFETADGSTCLEFLSAMTSGALDTGPVDLGFHHTP